MTDRTPRHEEPVEGTSTQDATGQVPDSLLLVVTLA
jgi:hypothetical protein